MELSGTMNDSASKSNETITSVTAGTPYFLPGIGIADMDFPAELSISAVVNQSNGIPFPENGTNWHYNSTFGSITLLATICSAEGTPTDCVEDVANTGFNITYSYASGGTKVDTLKNSTVSIRNITKQLPTVGIIIGVLLILGAVVMMARYFGGKEYMA